MDFAIINNKNLTFGDAAKSLAHYMSRHNISNVLLGLSGGADSVLTLHLLAHASLRMPQLKILACHANFHLRGSESNRDENFVKALADVYRRAESRFPNLKLDFEYRDFDTLSLAADDKISIEMAARKMRMEWWHILLTERGIDRIATGHHSDDNEETLLINILRGSSPHGLRAMQTCGNRIFRPLLGLPRKIIRRLLNEFLNSEDGKDFYLSDFPTGFVTDSSNLTSDYRRNFLRNEILPLLESRWPGVHTALQTTIQLQSEASKVIDYAVKDFLRRKNLLSLESESASGEFSQENRSEVSNQRVKKNQEIKWSDLSEFPSPTTLLYRWLSPLGLSAAAAGEIASHIPSGKELCMTPGRRWHLPGGEILLTTPIALRLVSPDDSRLNYLTSLPDSIRMEELTMNNEILSRIPTAGKWEIYLPHPFPKYEWSNPEKADRISLFPRKNGKKASKLVSDVLKEAGIEPSLRREVIVLRDRSTREIVWIPGIRRSGNHLIDKNTLYVYHINLHK